MSKQQSAGTRVVDGALALDSADGTRQLPLLAGAMHYHDLPRASWGRCLDALVDLGFELVDSCVPWAVYEPRRDQIALEGADRPSLAAFLEACGSRGLKVILQLGPLLDWELPRLGLPSWICGDKRYLALGAQDNPLIVPAAASTAALPSTASRAFAERAEQWLAALSRFLQPFCYPQGPLAAVHVGSRAGLAGRLGAYDHDYHPDAIAAYRSWLGQRYADGLPAAYRGVAETMEPPRRFEARQVEDLIVHFDWLTFKQSGVLRALNQLASTVRDNGLDRLALLHGLDETDLGLSCPLEQAERTFGAVGVELASPRPSARDQRRTALWLQGNSRLPFVWRLAWGNRPWLWLPQSTTQQRDSSLTALMYGARGASFNMAVERNHWIDGAIDSAGRPQPERYDQLRLLVRALRDLGWHELRREARVGLMRVREVEQLARCASLIDPLPPQLLALLGAQTSDLAADKPAGADGPDLGGVQRWSEAMEQQLRSERIPYVLVDSTLPAEQLSRYSLLLVPLLELADPSLLQRLGSYAAAGGQLLIGPNAPRMDLSGRELSAEVSGPLEGALLEDPALLAQALTQLEPSPDADLVETELETCLHRAADGAQGDSVLFLRNVSAGTQPAVLSEKSRFWDALTGVPLAEQTLQLQPGQLRMLRCRPAPAEGGP